MPAENTPARVLEGGGVAGKWCDHTPSLSIMLVGLNISPQVSPAILSPFWVASLNPAWSQIGQPEPGPRQEEKEKSGTAVGFFAREKYGSC